MSLEESLDRVLVRFSELRDTLASPDLKPDTLASLSKEYSDLEPIADAISRLRAAREELADLGAMVADTSGDPEMRNLAEEEFYALKARLPEMEKAVHKMLIPRDAADSRNAILEIRAGTGGDEAGLFAADLMEMYRKYAGLKGWKFELMDYHGSEVGGIKEGVFKIAGTSVFARLKFESGVHRVQRVPATETQGRIHTSAATVAVLPEVAEVDIDIDEKDLRVDTFRASGAGGQHVNKTDSAVRITHVPTGTVVAVQEEKSQHKNRARAMTILRSRIYDEQRRALDRERADERRAQVGSGDRSERIRTYNFPQGRVTDHRINLTLYKLEQVLSGEALDEVIDALIREDEAARLSEMV